MKELISIGGDHGRSVCWSFWFGAGTFGMRKTSEWKIPIGGGDFGVVKTSER